MNLRALVSFASFAGGIVGCTIGGETIVHEHAAAVSADAGTGSPSGTAAGGKSTASTCAGGTFVAADLSKLKACKAHGHCYPQNKLPPSTPGELFSPCDDPSEACVPDEILTAGGKKLKACTQPDAVKAVTGDGGGCVTIALLPEVERQAGQFLKQQECEPDQVCMPCTNPQDNSATPFCEVVGVYENACEEGGAAKPAASADAAAPAMPCCSANGKSNGVCMASTILPADKRDSMPRDVCASSDVCMPAAMLQGKGVSCTAGRILGKGVCLDACFNTMLKVADVLHALDRDVCGETELCTPCSILKDQMPPGITIPGCS